MVALIELLTCLFLPIILSTLTVLLISYTSKGFKESNQKLLEYTFSLHPEKGLIKQGMLWLSIATPVFYFLTLGMFAWTPYSIDISNEGFSKFITISALPLAILSISIPLSVLVSRFHATQQTAMQIQSTRLKNNIDAFYTHRKAMFDYFDKIGSEEFHGLSTCHIKLHPQLHKYAFFGSSPEKGMPIPSIDFFKTLERRLASARTFTHHTLFATTPELRLTMYISACTPIWQLAETLHLREINNALYERSFVIKQSGQIQALTVSIGTTTEELVGAYRYCRSFFRLLCDFAGYDSDILRSIDNETSDSFITIDVGSRYLKECKEPVEELLALLHINKDYEVLPAPFKKPYVSPPTDSHTSAT